MLKAGRINFSFAAAHHLPGYDGVCSKVHGHNYKLEVEVSGRIDPETGMIVDFALLKRRVEESIIKFLDHQNLNDLNAPFSDNPTAEKLVDWIVRKLNDLFDASLSAYLHRVRLWETDNCYIEWEKDY